MENSRSCERENSLFEIKSSVTIKDFENKWNKFKSEKIGEGNNQVIVSCIDTSGFDKAKFNIMFELCNKNLNEAFFEIKASILRVGNGKNLNSRTNVLVNNRKTKIFLEFDTTLKEITHKNFIWNDGSLVIKFSIKREFDAVNLSFDDLLQKEDVSDIE